MAKFDASFQEQLSFNFCATRASRKKLGLMLESRTSRLREIDLDLTAPASFSLSQAIVTSYQNMSWRTFCPVRLVLV
jgi:hypothetical protein